MTILSPDIAAPEPRPIARAMWRGFMGRCPHCGRGALFRAYLKASDACPDCGEVLHHHRADDAPPYMTIFVVGHVLIALYVAAEDYGPELPAWAIGLIFAALGGAMCLALLPRIKGALIGLQWALRMHGFHGPASTEGAQWR